MRLWRNCIEDLTPRKTERAAPPDDWQGWLAAVFGSHLRPPFADYHAEFWEWVWALERDEPARPFVAIWPRGFAKSTSVEVACAYVAATNTRRYGLYVCDTQDQADAHVENVAGLLESPGFSRAYPQASTRKVGKYGNSRGWRRNRLRTASGFTLDAIGLDSAVRGAKVDEDRPDFIVFDDVDDRLDTALAVEKKVTILTESILPARAAHAAVVFAQNLIHKNGIVARLADGRADFLADRIVSGPHPALVDAEFERAPDGWKIVKGTPTWAAMTIETLQTVLNAIGLRAFKREEQHEVNDAEGAIWSQDVIDEHREKGGVPDGISLARVVVGVDPPGATAECGIVVVGIGTNKRGYVLGDYSKAGTPNEWANAVVAAYDRHAADAVVVETNFGGPMATNTVRTVRPNLKVIAVTASRGKAIRAEPVSAVYDQGRVAHVGYFPALEDEMTGWVPGQPSPNRLDALVWACTELGLVTQVAETKPVEGETLQVLQEWFDE